MSTKFFIKHIKNFQKIMASL
ncbi:MAG: hypothetical protein LBR46_01575 [Prevotella sp.]|nr:hypothetical protein [Prevotella sp.]